MITNTLCGLVIIASHISNEQGAPDLNPTYLVYIIAIVVIIVIQVEMNKVKV